MLDINEKKLAIKQLNDIDDFDNKSIRENIINRIKKLLEGDIQKLYTGQYR